MPQCNLSIIIPVRIKSFSLTKEICDCYLKLITQCQHELSIEILIPDSSAEDIFAEFTALITDSAIKHFRAEKQFQTGKSDKLNNVHAAISKANGKYIAIFDDDVRPTKANIIAILARFNGCDFLRCMVDYPDPNIYDLIDLSGIFVINILSPNKQYWTNICFTANLINSNEFPNKDVLFDELSLELHCRRQSQKFCYLINPPLPIIRSSQRTLQKFMEQRIRYAYENLAFPLRFLFYLSILPLLIGIFIGYNLFTLGCFVVLISLVTAGIAWWGQKIYNKNCRNKLTWLYAIIWFWFYPFTTWIALIYWLKGGILFGVNRIKRPI